MVSGAWSLTLSILRILARRRAGAQALLTLRNICPAARLLDQRAARLVPKRPRGIAQALLGLLLRGLLK